VKRAARLLFLLLVPVVPLAQERIDTTLSSLPSQRDILYLRTGDQVRRMFPGLEGLMSSVYWLRAVQYYGHQRAFVASPTYDLLGPLIEITNALDPRMELAYRYGAIFLSEAWPIGAGKPDEGIDVLERGVEALPGNWRLRWDLGGLWFFFKRDHQQAARVFLDAAKLPGAPFWLESLAANVLGKGGHRDIAREIWKQQYEHGGVAAIRDNALFHLQQIDALDESDVLSALAVRFAEREGRPPTSPRELVDAGLAARIRADPSGVAFAYDPDTGRFSIARGSKFWRSRYDQ
jgi:hypothetical protein